MLTGFRWPVPPHYDLITPPSDPAGNDAEPAQVTMQNGRSQEGLLVGLDGAEMCLEFRTRRASSTVRIGFGNLQLLRLTDAVEMKQIALSQGLSDATGAPLQQKCVLHYYSGLTLETATLGVVVKPFGLFLFAPVAGGTHVERWFIPSEAIKSHQIGEQLGKLLVDEQLVSADVLTAGLEKQEQMRSQKLGDYLLQQKIITQEHVEIALQSQKSKPQLRLGEALLQEKLITEQQLTDALANQAENRKLPLGDILVEMKIVTLDTIKRVLAQKLGIPFVNLRGFQFDPALIKAVPGEFVRKHNIMPLYQTESRMVVAMENPLAHSALQELAFYTKLKIDPVMAAVEDLRLVIGQMYGSGNERGNIAELVFELGGEDDGKLDAPTDVITESDNTLVRLVNKIIMDAYDLGVSDIHIENMKGNHPTRVRFRKDGQMQPYSEVPAQFRNALVSRIKIMCRLDISEKRRSQDGKINFERFGPAAIELRVLTIPTTEGLEDIVMRILAAPKAVSIDTLGLSQYGLEGLKKLALKPHGLLFVCGPTGSGKTTTLHSLLNYINTPDRKIWTVEDPVEITQDGLRQVQVQAKIDWTFAAVLRSFMRADPDVIMVGETRDPETAKTVIEASLTGHLVFSTMHTNSAAESVVRLLDFGLDPFNFADALLGVVGQRLARRLCAHCKSTYPASNEEIELLAYEYCFETEVDPAALKVRWRQQFGRDGGHIALFKASGCDLCSGTGYKGRLGIHEVLIATAAVKKKIHARANVPEVLKVAVSEGMLTLRQDGIEKILQGHTDWEQIRTV